MSQYYPQNSTTNALTGEIWSEGSNTYSGDGGDNEIQIPSSGYAYAFVHIRFSGSGVATNSYTQFHNSCLLYTSPSPRDVEESRMPSSA